MSKIQVEDCQNWRVNMKNNFQWISESRSQIHNVQTFMNGKKRQAFKKHNGEEKRIHHLIGKSEEEYRLNN